MSASKIFEFIKKVIKNESDIKKINEELERELFFKDGEVFEPSLDAYNAIDCAGMLTNSQTEIMFFIPLGKSLKYINRVTIDSLCADIRHANGGYIAHSTDELSTYGTTTTYKLENSGIRIVLKLKTKSSLTNNCPVTATIMKLKLTFHS